MVNLLVMIFQTYLLLGALFAIAFIARGAAMIDHDVSASPWRFRILLIPGTILLWPVLLLKWMKL